MQPKSMISTLLLFALLHHLHAARILQKIIELDSARQGTSLPTHIAAATPAWFKDNRGHESVACGRKDLVKAAIDTFYSLFVQECSEWVDAFVPDHLGPSMWHFQWEKTIVGRESLLAFCNSAHTLIKDNNLDPVNVLTHKADAHFIASGGECRTISKFGPGEGAALRPGAGGYELIFMMPLDAQNNPTLNMEDVVRYGITSYTEVAQDAQHSIPYPGTDWITTDPAPVDSQEAESMLIPMTSATPAWFKDNRGHESLACGRKDLVKAAIDTFYSLFVQECSEWVDAFVPDHLGPSMWHFQWEKTILGRESLLAFCNSAHILIKDNNLDPVNVLTHKADAHFIASGGECRTISKFGPGEGAALRPGAGGYELIFMMPLDAQNEPTLIMENVVKYGIISYTEVAHDMDHSILYEPTED